MMHQVTGPYRKPQHQDETAKRKPTPRIDRIRAAFAQASGHRSGLERFQERYGGKQQET
jgi:hypothetical protein